MLTNFGDSFPFYFDLKTFSHINWATFFYYFIMLAHRMECMSIYLVSMNISILELNKSLGFLLIWWHNTKFIALLRSLHTAFIYMQMSREAFQKSNHSHRLQFPTFLNKLLSNGSKCMLILMTYVKMSKINLSPMGTGRSFRSVAGVTSRHGFLQIFCFEKSICELTVWFQVKFIKSQRNKLRDKQKKNNVCTIKASYTGFQVWRLKCPVRIELYSWIWLEYARYTYMFPQYLYLYLDGDWDEVLIRNNSMQFNKYYWALCIFQIWCWAYTDEWQNACRKRARD